MHHAQFETISDTAQHVTGGLVSLVPSVGTPQFSERLASLLFGRFGSDACIMRRCGAGFELLTDGNDPTAQSVHRAYSITHFKSDPSLEICDGVQSDGFFVVPLKIDDQNRLRCAWLSKAGYDGKVAFIQKEGNDLLILSTLTRATDPKDTDTSIIGLAQVLLPLVALHYRISNGNKPKPRVSAEDMEKRICENFPELTRREREVCARSIIGMTAEGIALDLEIGQTSVLTYRRRAYSRLNINSINQLSSMLIQSAPPAAFEFAA